MTLIERAQASLRWRANDATLEIRFEGECGPETWTLEFEQARVRGVRPSGIARGKCAILTTDGQNMRLVPVLRKV